MKINDIDIKEKYGNKVLLGQESIRERKIVTFTEWLDGAAAPVVYKKPEGRFYDIEVEFIIKADSKTEAELTMSNIATDCAGGKIKLDSVDLTLTGELIEIEKEFIKRWTYRLLLRFRAWDKTENERIVLITESAKTIIVEGNQETPCIIELIPKAAIITYTIRGVARDPVTGEDEEIVIKNLKAGQKIVINGEDGTITENGKNKFAETEMWEFPSLLPGQNILSFESSSVSCSVTIKYKPRYY